MIVADKITGIGLKSGIFDTSGFFNHFIYRIPGVLGALDLHPVPHESFSIRSPCEINLHKHQRHNRKLPRRRACTESTDTTNWKVCSEGTAAGKLCSLSVSV